MSDRQSDESPASMSAVSPVSDPATDKAGPDLSVVVPVLNEEPNVEPLVREIVSALEGVCRYEIVYVDDGSTDGTPRVLDALKSELDVLRVVRHSRRAGQSTGLRSGMLAARGRLVATLDGDGQNDPADIPALYARHGEGARSTRFRMVTGHRVNRRDTWSKRRASRLANAIRRGLLGDDNPDTGCSLKLYERELFLRLPYFNHMHRFLPALAQREDCEVLVVPVNHRHRRAGQSKYKILDRLFVGIPDLLGVMWLLRRSVRRLDVEEL